jgi:hypothetical protein
MGILSDFVVADRSEASAVGGDVARDSWPNFPSTGFTTLEVGLLYFALTGRDARAPVSPPEFVKNPYTGKMLPVSVGVAYLEEFTCLDDGGESWVHEVPASLVEELVRATDLEAVASRWVQYEELRDADSNILADLLTEVQGLARLAKEQGKSLLLATSL